MNRAVSAVLAFVVGLLIAFLWMQQTQVKPLREKVANSEKQIADLKKAEVPIAQWETLSDGTKVMRIWDKVAPSWPQIAMLELSSDLYKKFQKDPSGFVNSDTIFPALVKEHAPLIPAQTIRRDYTGNWIVLSGHRPTSTDGNVSFAEEEESANLPEKPH